MTFNEEFANIALMQQELQQSERDLIIKTLKNESDVIADERVKKHYEYKDDYHLEFDSRVSIAIPGRHGDIDIDIYSLLLVETEFGYQINVTGFTEDGDEISDRLYPEFYSGALIFISNYFDETL